MATRFLARNGLAGIDDPVTDGQFGDGRLDWEKALKDVLVRSGYNTPEYYALRDDRKLTIYNPYVPEKEERESKIPTTRS